MSSYKVGSNGQCTTCECDVDDCDILKCFDCKSYFHAVCNTSTPFCNKTFLGTFKKIKSINFLFVCDSCVTLRETNETSTLNEQIHSLTTIVQKLVTDVQSLKSSKCNENNITTNQPSTLTSLTYSEKVKSTPASLCIKSNGTAVDLKKLSQIAVDNAIQVTKTTVKDNGDVFVNLPTTGNGEKLLHFLMLKICLLKMLLRKFRLNFLPYLLMRYQITQMRKSLFIN